MDYFNQQSDRLRYRGVTESDIPKWVDFFQNNDSLKYLGIDIQKSKEVLSKEWIHKQLGRYEEYGFGHLAVELKSTGQLIGMCGILRRMLKDVDGYEIAYSLKPQFWGNGYATEMAKTMKKYGFQNIETNQMISMIHIDNHNSAKVAVKNGMSVLYQSIYRGMKVNIYGIDRANNRAS